MPDRPKPPPLPADENLAVQIVLGGGQLLWRALRYWGRRTRQCPPLGLLYAATVPWAVWTTVSHLGALFPPLGRGVRATLTPAMLQSGTLLLACMLLIILVIGLDGRLARHAAQQTADIPPPPPVPHDVLLLGHRIERTWDKSATAFVEHPGNAPFTLCEAELRTSVGICATTGQGKSRGFLDEFLGWTERTHNNCQWIDPKGDDADRSRFTHVFDLAHLDQSFLWDLYGDLTPTQAAEALGEAIFTGVPGMDGASEYFSEVAKEALRAIFVAHATANTLALPNGKTIAGRSPTPLELYNYVANPATLQALADSLPATSTAAGDLQHVLKLANSANDALGQIFNKIGPLARSEIATHLVSGPEGLSIRELVNTPGVRVLWALDGGRQRRMSAILGRLVVSLWTYAILDRTVRKDYLKLLLVDEASVFAATCPDLPAGMVICRSHNAGYVLAFQNLNQLGNLRGLIWDACGTKIMMGMAPVESAALFSQEVGEREYPFIGTSDSENIGRGGGASTHGGLVGGTGGSGTSRSRSSGRSSGTSESYQRRATWLPRELQDLAPYHAVVLASRYIPDAPDSSGGGRDIALIRLDNRDPALIAQRAGQHAQAQRLEQSLQGRPTGPAGTCRDAATLTQLRATLHLLLGRWWLLPALTAETPPSEQQYRSQLAYALAVYAAWYDYHSGAVTQPPTTPLPSIPTPPTEATIKALPTVTLHNQNVAGQGSQEEKPAARGQAPELPATSLALPEPPTGYTPQPSIPTDTLSGPVPALSWLEQYIQQQQARPKGTLPGHVPPNATTNTTEKAQQLPTDIPPAAPPDSAEEAGNSAPQAAPAAQPKPHKTTPLSTTAAPSIRRRWDAEP
ncbi:MAG: TraM recognition domain-containing protein [Chloroflexota bacterium]|nr:TraM recognition domain-containing protein [Chloroflexota bacterium]